MREKKINKYGIIHFISSKTASYTQPKKNKYFGLLFLLDIIFDFSKNTNKNSAVFFALILKKHLKNKKIFVKKNLLYLKYILKKMINSKYINEIYKKKLKYNFFEVIYKI